MRVSEEAVTGEDKKKCLIAFPTVEKENWNCLVRHPRETVGDQRRSCDYGNGLSAERE